MAPRIKLEPFAELALIYRGKTSDRKGWKSLLGTEG